MTRADILKEQEVVGDDWKLEACCDKCGEPIGDNTYRWTMRKYGKALCMDEQEVQDFLKSKATVADVMGSNRY